MTTFCSSKKEVFNFSLTSNSIQVNIAQLNNLNVTNFALPASVNEFLNMTQELNQFLQSDQVDNTFSYDWIVIIAFVFLMLLAIGGSVSAYFNVKVVYVVLGYLLFFSFLILSVAAITTVSFGAFASNFCASGIDTNMRTIINSFDTRNDTCLEEISKKFLFCDEFNATCDPFSDVNQNIRSLMVTIQEEIDNNNTNPNLPTALGYLRTLDSLVVTFKNCSGTHAFYVSFTNSICFGSVASLVNLSTALELISLIIFLFLLTSLYTWHRITQPGFKAQIYDYESISTHSKVRKNELSPTEIKEMDCSTGCVLHVALMILFWGLFTFGAFVVLSFGAEETQVPRFKLE